MSAIYKKELKSLFTNMTGVVFVAWVLFWIGYYVRYYMFQNYVPNFEYVCVAAPFLAFLVIPILTMRSFAEEKHSRTDQLLYSLPMTTGEVVLGKFLSMVTVLAIPMAIAACYPLLLRMYGPVNLVTAYVALFGMFILGCSMIAICMFISSLTESQLIAAVLSFGVVLLIYEMNSISSGLSTEASTSLLGTIILAALVGLLVFLLTKSPLLAIVIGGAGCVLTIIMYAIDATKYEGLMAKLLSSVAMFYRMVNFGYGLIDLTTLIFYISIAVLFLFFTGQSLEKKRWC